MIIEPLTEEKLVNLFGSPTPFATPRVGRVDQDGISLDDRLTGDNEVNKKDLIIGLGGDDELYGNSGNDFIDGGWSYQEDGSLIVEHGLWWEGARSDDDKLYGGIGNDVLVGGHGNDLLVGGSGDDYLIGDALTVHVSDSGIASTEPATVQGSGNDVLIGSSGNDYLHSGGGINILNGGHGDDTLVSRGDSDVLIGGPGRDTFDVDDEYYPIVKITDFQDGYDQIHIDSDSAIVDLYHMVTQANMQWDWEWFATDLEDGVFIPAEEGGGIMINGVDPADLAFEFVGEDVFIV